MSEDIDFEQENFIKYYDDLYDPKFNEESYQLYIYKKAEFSELSSDPEEKFDTRGNFFKHQKLNQRLMLAVDNLFIIDEAGTGKTGSMAATAEYFLENKEDINKVIMISPNETLINEAQSQIVNDLTSGKYDPGFTKNEQAEIDAGTDPTSILTETKMRIRRTKKLKKNGYIFTTPTKFIKMIMKDKRFRDKEYLRKKYSNTLFIIDEIQKLRMELNITVENKLKSKYRELVKKEFKKESEGSDSERLPTKEEKEYVSKDILEYFEENRLDYMYNEDVSIYEHYVSDSRKYPNSNAEERKEWVRGKLASTYEKYYDEVYEGEDIIDFFQNKDRTGLTNAEKYSHLWRIFHTVDNSKVMILSATPMVSKPSELYHFLNLLLPSFLQFETPIVREASKRYGIDVDFHKLNFDIDNIDNNHIEQNSRELEPFLRGKISFVSAVTSSKDVNIFYLPNKQYAKYYIPDRYDLKLYEPVEYIDYNFEAISEFSKYYNYDDLHDSGNLHKIRLYYEEMSRFQSEVYIKEYIRMKKKSKKKSQAARQNEINISNFAFPNGQHGRVGYKTYVKKQTKTTEKDGKTVSTDIPDLYEFDDTVMDPVEDDEISHLGIDLYDDIFYSIDKTAKNERIMLQIIYHVMKSLKEDYSIHLLSQVIGSLSLKRLSNWSPTNIVQMMPEHTNILVDNLEQGILLQTLENMKIVMTEGGILIGSIFVDKGDINKYDQIPLTMFDSNTTVETLIDSLGMKFNILYYSYKDLFDNLEMVKRGNEFKMNIKQRVKNMYFLRKMSVKFHDIVKAAKENQRKQREGRSEEMRKIYVYFSLIKGSNMVIAMLCLIENGISRYDPSGLGKINAPSSKGELLDLDQKDKLLRVALFKGIETSDVERDNIKNLFNHPMNVFGEYISIILVSEVGQTGISLKDVQDIHIMNPQWNPSDTHQATYRGIRQNGFDQLLDVKKIIEASGKFFSPIEINIRIHCAFVNRDVVQEQHQIPGNNFDVNNSVDYEAYKKAINKAINIDKVSDIMKEHSITCLIHEERNKNKDNGIECYTCKTMSCEEIYKLKGIDESTYSFYDIEDKQDIIDKVINDYYQRNTDGELEDIYEHYINEFNVGDEPLKRKFFTYILSKSINEEKIYYDKFGFKNFLKEDTGIYYLTKDYDNFNDDFKSYYSEHLITTQCDTLSSYVNVLEDVKFEDRFENIFSLSYDIIVKRFNIGNIPVAEIGFFLEKIIIMYVFDDMTYETEEKVIKFLDLFYPSILITTEPTYNIKNAPDRNPTKNKRAKTKIESSYNVDKIENYDEKRIGISKDTFRLPGKNDKAAFVHNFFIIPDETKRKSGIVANIFKSEGRLRILDFDRKEWRDMSPSEYIIYNVGFQYRNRDFKNYMYNETTSVYLLPVNSFYRVAELPSEKNGRKEHTGRIIRTLDAARKNKEFDLIYNDIKTDIAVKAELKRWRDFQEGRSLLDMEEKLIEVLKNNKAVVYFTGFVSDYNLPIDYPGFAEYRNFIDNYMYIEYEGENKTNYDLPLTDDRERNVEIALLARTSFMTPMEKKYVGIGAKVDVDVPKLLEKYTDIRDIIDIPLDF